MYGEKQIQLGSYLARLPIESNELSNTSKFLNQVSDYSLTLSRKNIYNEPLTEQEQLKLDAYVERQLNKFDYFNNKQYILIVYY